MRTFPIGIHTHAVLSRTQSTESNSKGSLSQTIMQSTSLPVGLFSILILGIKKGSRVIKEKAFHIFAPILLHFQPDLNDSLAMLIIHDVGIKVVHYHSRRLTRRRSPGNSPRGPPAAPRRRSARPVPARPLETCYYNS